MTMRDLVIKAYWASVCAGIAPEAFTPSAKAGALLVAHGDAWVALGFTADPYVRERLLMVMADERKPARRLAAAAGGWR